MTELRPFRNIRTSRVTGNVTPGPGRDQLRPGWGEGEPGVAGTQAATEPGQHWPTPTPAMMMIRCAHTFYTEHWAADVTSLNIKNKTNENGGFLRTACVLTTCSYYRNVKVWPLFVWQWESMEGIFLKFQTNICVCGEQAEISYCTFQGIVLRVRVGLLMGIWAFCL